MNKETTIRGFESREVVSPDGEPYTHPEELAGELVVILHGELKEVFSYTRASLAALDERFARLSPEREYKPSYLLSDFVPMLGAYLGRVLVRGLGGRWLARSPLMKSTVEVGGRELHPFRAAYHVAHGRGRLAEFFDEAAGLTPDSREKEA